MFMANHQGGNLKHSSDLVSGVWDHLAAVSSSEPFGQTELSTGTKSRNVRGGHAKSVPMQMNYGEENGFDQPPLVWSETGWQTSPSNLTPERETPATRNKDIQTASLTNSLRAINNWFTPKINVLKPFRLFRQHDSRPRFSERIWNRQEDPSQRVEPGTPVFVSDQSNVRFAINVLLGLAEVDSISDEPEVLRKRLPENPLRHITIFWTPAGVSGTYTGKRNIIINRFLPFRSPHFQHWGLIIQDTNFIETNGFCIELDTVVEDRKMIIFPKARSWYVRLAEAVAEVGKEKACTIFRFYRTGVWTAKSNQEIFDIAKETCQGLGGTYNLFSSNCQDFANGVISAIEMKDSLVHIQPRWTPMKSLGRTFSATQESLVQDDAKEQRLPSDYTFGKPIIATKHNIRVDEYMAHIPENEMDDFSNGTGFPNWMTAVLKDGNVNNRLPLCDYTHRARSI